VSWAASSRRLKEGGTEMAWQHMFDRAIRFVLPKEWRKFEKMRSWQAIGQAATIVREKLSQDPSKTCLEGIQTLRSLPPEEMANMRTGVLLGIALASWARIEGERCDQLCDEAEVNLAALVEQVLREKPPEPDDVPADIPDAMRELLAKAKELGIKYELHRINCDDEEEDEDEPLIH